MTSEPDRLTLLMDWLENEPFEPFNHYALALELVRLQKMGEARMVFERLYQQFPDYLPAYYQFALFLIRSGELMQAEEILKKGVRLAEVQNEEKTRLELSFLLDDLVDS